MYSRAVKIMVGAASFFSDFISGFQRGKRFFEKYFNENLFNLFMFFKQWTTSVAVIGNSDFSR